MGVVQVITCASILTKVTRAYYLAYYISPSSCRIWPVAMLY